MHSDGYLMGYAQDYGDSEAPLLRMVMDQSGFGSTDAEFSHGGVGGVTISSATSISFGPNEYLSDTEGIYGLNVADQTFETLVKQPIDSVGLFERLGNHTYTVYTRHQFTVRLYDIVPEDESIELPGLPTGQPEGFVSGVVWPKTKLTLRQTIQLPDDWFDWGELPSGWDLDRIFNLGEDGFQLVQERRNIAFKTLRINDAGLADEPKIFVCPKPESPPLITTLPLVVMPPALLAMGTVHDAWQWGFDAPDASAGQSELALMIVLMIVHSVSAWWLTTLACDRRHLGQVERRWWRWTSLAFGMVVPVIILCLRESIVVADCPDCGRPFRVDESVCPTCGAPHALTPSRGIEIMRGY